MPHRASSTRCAEKASRGKTKARRQLIQTAKVNVEQITVRDRKGAGILFLVIPTKGREPVPDLIGGEGRHRTPRNSGNKPRATALRFFGGAAIG
jgi:hypothetical protein